MQYIGFDIHERYTFFTQMDDTGAIQRQGRLPNTREAMGAFFADVAEPAQVAMEAGPTWYYIYDLLETLRIPVTLAHPLRTRAIAEAKVKTDKVDSTILAHLLRADLVPAAYIPPREIRDLRELLRYRAALVRLQTKVKNHVHAILLKHGYQAPVSDVFGVRGRAWLSTLPLRPVYQHRLHGFAQILDTLRGQIQSASRLIDQEAQATPLAQTLCTLPGVGHYTALLLLAEIGDIRRFPSPKRLVSYAGLAPTVHASGITPASAISPGRARAGCGGFWSKSPPMPAASPAVSSSSTSVSPSARGHASPVSRWPVSYSPPRTGCCAMCTEAIRSGLPGGVWSL